MLKKNFLVISAKRDVIFANTDRIIVKSREVVDVNRVRTVRANKIAKHKPVHYILQRVPDGVLFFLRVYIGIVTIRF